MREPCACDLLWRRRVREDAVAAQPSSLDLGPPGNKADRYFPYGWRDVAWEGDPREGPALRSFYKAKLATQLGYEHTAEFDPVIRNARYSELYKLIFASKHKLGLKIWDEVNGPGSDPQLAFPLDFI